MALPRTGCGLRAAPQSAVRLVPDHPAATAHLVKLGSLRNKDHASTDHPVVALRPILASPVAGHIRNTQCRNVSGNRTVLGGRDARCVCGGQRTLLSREWMRANGPAGLGSTTSCRAAAVGSIERVTACRAARRYRRRPYLYRARWCGGPPPERRRRCRRLTSLRAVGVRNVW
jgi:hypothetical protein